MRISILCATASLGLWCALSQAATPTPPAPPEPPMPPEPPSPSQLERQLERQLEQASEQVERSAREVTELSMKLGGEAGSMPGRSRAMLGISIGDPASGDATSGVRVLSVSPGGPAEIAGLKANDVIVSFHGVELRGDAHRSAREQLLALIRDTEPDSQVALRYRRGDQIQETRLIPKSTSSYYEFTLPRELSGLEELQSLRPLFGRSGGFGSAELLALSPGLGRYFGTDKGLLVVHAPHDGRLKLEDGDVILDIDGRVPSGVSHAFQILGSYRPGEALKLHIMRQQKRMELPVEIPGDAHESSARSARSPAPGVLIY